MKKIILIMLAGVLVGCKNTPSFYREINGVSNSIALSLPDEEAFKVQVAEYLSGSKTIVKDSAIIQHQYATVSSNDYFGLIHIKEQRTNSISIFPYSTTNIVDAVNKK